MTSTNNLPLSETDALSVPNLSVENGEGCTTTHAPCDCLVINPYSQGNLLLFQFICMLPKSNLLPVEVLGSEVVCE